MPFLRVLRDKRGYETTYLVHWFRDGNRQRSRILYVFRTPPGVRVGRDVLDSEAVREIEAAHPEIQFDWRALVDTRQVIDQGAEARRQRPARKKTSLSTAAQEEQARTQPALTIPAAIEGETQEQQLAFLNRWYPELRDRVPHRTQDPIRREALLALVERLNPAAWETQEQAAAGLQDAAEALERISRVLSKRRRRTRRTRPAAADAAAPAVMAADGEPTPEPAEAEPEDGTSPADEPV